MHANTAIIWFRRDLRLMDHAALNAALQAHQWVIPLYIHEHIHTDEWNWPLGSASAWWLHHSLLSLQAALRQRGSDLLIRRGELSIELGKFIKASGATAVYWHRQYEPRHIARDAAIQSQLNEAGIACHSFNDSLLPEPGAVLTRNDRPYQVFTPFWQACRQRLQARGPLKLLAVPRHLPAVPDKLRRGSVRALKLLPEIKWYSGFDKIWRPGEAGAQRRLDAVCDEIARHYADSRDRPDIDGTTRLSPHLHFGEISPRQIQQRFETLIAAGGQAGLVTGVEACQRQLGWRDFARHLLFHFPQTPDKPLRDAYAKFSWRKKYAKDLQRWQAGQTGIPIIDAGMRQLWATGWMHNRVRMLVASLLTKNLLIPWQEGARWFWDTLVDADLANNTLGWQWVAGCGADAAPYFRIFNPVTQGERFDPRGGYVRSWVPELRKLNTKYIHQPWIAPAQALQDAGIRLGKDYPIPMVDLKASRIAALNAYQKMKSTK